MKRSARFILLLAWFMLWIGMGLTAASLARPNLAHGATVLYEAWVYESDSTTITVAWDAVESAEYYEVKMESLHPVQTWAQNVSNLQATFTRPRTGLYRFYVRACSTQTDPTCSEWTRSDGPGSILTKADGQTISQAWMVLFRLAAPIPK